MVAAASLENVRFFMPCGDQAVRSCEFLKLYIPVVPIDEANVSQDFTMPEDALAPVTSISHTFQPLSIQDQL